ncbi:MAG: hypothetical protein K1W04_02455 [Oscillospiraceae bacterium]
MGITAIIMIAAICPARDCRNAKRAGKETALSGTAPFFFAIFRKEGKKHGFDHEV